MSWGPVRTEEARVERLIERAEHDRDPGGNEQLWHDQRAGDRYERGLTKEWN